MANTNGMTNKDWKQFKDLLVKANDEQIISMMYSVKEEYKKRGGK